MHIIDLELLIEAWEEDSVVDKKDPDSDILRIPNLHSKYASQLIAHNSALRKKRVEFNELLRIKHHYYSGKLNNKEDLAAHNWEPFQYTVKGKTDIDSYINADPDLNALKVNIGMHEDAINFCEMVVKELSNRTWQIKAYLDYSKYKLGQ